MKHVGVVGCGIVGSAMARWLTEAIVRSAVRRYDPAKGFDCWTGIEECDVVFVCVPTPMAEDGSCDVSLVEASVDRIAVKNGVTIVIRSTVEPGTTARLQKKHGNVRLVFMPEFLSDDTAFADFTNPTRHVVGFARDEDRWIGKQLLQLLPAAPDVLVTGSTDAELIKYFANCWYATKVAFANQMYDLATAIGAHYEVVRKAASLDPMCGGSHLDVFHKGYRGFGGKCLPKDVSALLTHARREGVEMSVLRAVKEYNERLCGRGSHVDI